MSAPTAQKTHLGHVVVLAQLVEALVERVHAVLVREVRFLLGAFFALGVSKKWVGVKTVGGDAEMGNGL